MTNSPKATLPAAAALRLRSPGGARDATVFDAAGDDGGSRAARITALIEAGFDAPGAAPGWAEALSIVDRQIAVYRLALDHGLWPAWFVAVCADCAALIDLRVAADEFPVTPAPGPVPAELNVQGPGGIARFRVPTGAEEAALEARPDTGLFSLCVLSGDLRGDPAAWQAAFESALAAVLPGFEAELRFPCPECGTETGWWFDPLDWIARHAGQCFAEVDALARTYGWSEAEILGMAPARRRLYLTMIGEGA